MAIQLGTVAPIGFDNFPPAEWLGCFRELGCEVVQAYRNPDAEITFEEMTDAIAAGQMPCDSLHGVYGEQFDPSSPDEEARKSAVDSFKADGELALQLGGSIVVVHCASIRRGGISPEQHARRIAQLEKSVLDLSEFAQSVGVRYAFENLPWYHAIGSDVGEIVGVLEKLRAPKTGMCFDTGHANMVCDLAEAIRQAADQIIYVHFSDNSGQEDEHQLPGDGTIDVNAVALALHEAQYHGTMMLEVFYEADAMRKIIDDGYAERLAHMLQIANGAPVK